MEGLTIAWEYLTGYAVATDVSSRERAEWPPHPARVFMAMAAAWFETDPGEGASEADQRAHDDEGRALRWLEGLDVPEIWVVRAGNECERTCVTVYVPVNDKARRPAKGIVQSAAGLLRERQGRTFPRRFVGNTPVYLHWEEANGIEEHLDALSRVCAKVTRIGHSSSLVWMWCHGGAPRVEEDEERASGIWNLERWVPSEGIGQWYGRCVTQGLLDALPEQTQIAMIQKFARLTWQIQDAQRDVFRAKAEGDTAAKKVAEKALRDAKRAYQDAFGKKYGKSNSPPPRLRPRVGLWKEYRRADRESAPDRPCESHFNSDLLVLAQVGGPRLPLVSTLAICSAMRGAVMSHCPDSLPQWVSGHAPDGSASELPDGHMAIIPLPFVGHTHADGHLLGVAIVLPRTVEGQELDRRESGRVLGPLLVDQHGEPREVELRMGRIGRVSLRLAEWDEPRQTLQPEAWTASPRGASVWTTVTPVVLDRYPKADKSGAREKWEREVRDLIASACVRIGLASPEEIDIDTTSWNLGSPRSICKQRRIRGGPKGTVCYGDGFPAFPARGVNGPRPQVHVRLRFRDPVIGPVLLGAGRYRGYGLFKPQISAGEVIP